MKKCILFLNMLSLALGTYSPLRSDNVPELVATAYISLSAILVMVNANKPSLSSSVSPFFTSL